ncbi:MAG: hypothetical protein QOJ45_1310 [Verrucomicrobiota bacterium]|jgi:FkbM family methyltransferase
MADFASELFRKLLDSQFENHVHNYDTYRFGDEVKSRSWSSFRGIIDSLARKAGFVRRQELFSTTSKLDLEAWSPHFPALDWMFQNLADDESRRLLIDLAAYRILGYRHIRLPLSTPRFWTQLTDCASLADEGDTMKGAGGFTLMRQRLDKLGFPISLYMPKGGPLTTFVLGQYSYRQPGIGVNRGDVVIDAGACWGDTALYFAHLAGPSGKVYSFEFMEENIRVFERNISMNPLLANRIELIAQPLWSSSGVLMTSSGAGPGSRTVAATKGCESGLHSSLAIDDFAKDRRLAHIDFIKMDIEGAELEALSGARESLIAFQPDLALCVYHSVDHFWLLARYLDGLGLGYRFYLGHFTIHAEETVLFATARSKPVSIH